MANCRAPCLCTIGSGEHLACATHQNHDILVGALVTAGAVGLQEDDILVGALVTAGDPSKSIQDGKPISRRQTRPARIGEHGILVGTLPVRGMAAVWVGEVTATIPNIGYCIQYSKLSGKSHRSPNSVVGTAATTASLPCQLPSLPCQLPSLPCQLPSCATKSGRLKQ